MTSAARVPPLRWWGWGERATPPPPGLLRLLREELGVADQIVRPAPDVQQVRMPEPMLSAPLRHRLVAIVGGVHVRDDAEERVRHAAGRSYLDLLRLRSGALQPAPDAVVHPADAAEVAAVLRACADAGCGVVPFGGGTSVVGGVTPERGPHRAVVALDLDRLDALMALDRTSMLATLQAGMRGPQIESHLRARGVTLGHFPQSFEYATAGGFAAARSAGQASGGYGRFDSLVRGISLATPVGDLRIAAQPPDAVGPSLLQLVLGSEGALGVIDEVTVRVRSLPQVRRYAGWSFPDFAGGLEAFRELAQSRHVHPDVARLADADETRAGFAMSESVATAAAIRYLRLRGHAAPCLAILGWEDGASEAGQRERRAAAVLRRHGALSLGGAPGRSWLRGRFAGPYLRDSLLDRAMLVETLETAATWARLDAVRDSVVEALRTSLESHGTWPLIGSHVSHMYPEGASLYFTVLAAQAPGREVEQWVRAKRAATDALLAAGGVLTHHHGVGRDHARWLPRVAGEHGVAALRALKATLDPAGVMNPGVLLPPG